MREVRVLTIFIAAAVIGGVLVVASAFGGGDGDLDHDADFHADVDGHVDFDGDADFQGDVDGHDGGGDFAWLPFLSLRFWTFFLAFFGMTGALLMLLTSTRLLTVVALSVAVGFVTGFGVTTLMRLMKKTQADSGFGSRDMVGAEGQVLLPLRVGEVGKVRVRIKGEVVDLMARVDGAESLEIGEEVILIGFDDHVATVIRRDDLVERLSAGNRAALQAAQKTAKS